MSMTDAGAGDGLFMFNSDFHSDRIVGNVGSLRLLFDFTDLINFTPDADSNLKTHRVYFPPIVGTFDQTPKRSSGKRPTKRAATDPLSPRRFCRNRGKCRAELGRTNRCPEHSPCHLLVKCSRLAARSPIAATDKDNAGLQNSCWFSSCCSFRGIWNYPAGDTIGFVAALERKSHSDCISHPLSHSFWFSCPLLSATSKQPARHSAWQPWLLLEPLAFK